MDVFVSYRRNDRETVWPIVQFLEANDISVWIDAKLEPGSAGGFDAEIEREIADSAAVVVCWTPASVDSIYVQAEAHKGRQDNKLVPVILKHCSLKVPFNAIETIDLTQRTPESERRLLDSVNALKERRKKSEAVDMASAERALMALPVQLYPGSVAFIVERLKRFANFHELSPTDWSCDQYHLDVMAALAFVKEIYAREITDLDRWHANAEKYYGSSTEFAWEKILNRASTAEAGGSKFKKSAKL